MISMHVPKTIKRNKILHSDQFSLGRAPQLGKNSNEREKKSTSQANRYSGEGKGSKQSTRFLCRFTPFFAIFSPQRSLVLGDDPLGNNSSAARKSFGMSMQVAINKLDSLKA